MEILYSYFRYTGILFLRCALFVARCNTIRASWETKKKSLSYRKKYIAGFVWGTSLFWLHALLSMSFCCFLCLLPPTFQVTWLRNGPYKDIHIAMGGILYDIAWYCYRLCFSFSCLGYDLTLIRKSHTFNYYLFLQTFLLKT